MLGKSLIMELESEPDLYYKVGSQVPVRVWNYIWRKIHDPILISVARQVRVNIRSEDIILKIYS